MPQDDSIYKRDISSVEFKVLGSISVPDISSMYFGQKSMRESEFSTVMICFILVAKL
jgi:hypothetical protein